MWIHTVHIAQTGQLPSSILWNEVYPICPCLNLPHTFLRDSKGVLGYSTVQLYSQAPAIEWWFPPIPSIFWLHDPGQGKWLHWTSLFPNGHKGAPPTWFERLNANVGMKPLSYCQVRTGAQQKRNSHAVRHVCTQEGFWCKPVGWLSSEVLLNGKSAMFR